MPLALRAATLAVIAAALLGVLLFRMWALQVLHSDQYVAAAAQNSVRTITMPSPRGEILDRDGHVLVSNTATIAVQVDAARLPHGTDCGPTIATHRVGDQRGCGVLKRLAWVLDVPYGHMWHTFSHLARANPGYPVTLPFDVDRRQTSYVLERRWLFQGVAFEHVYQRTYPSLREFGPTNPNLLGFVGAITAENLKDRSYHEKLPRIGTAGQGGVEKTYDRYLRGQDGTIQETVDPAGAPVGQAFLTQSPIAGDNLRLTIDARLQKVAQYAVGQGIAIAHANGEPADSGAVVAMNPDTGAIYAMASSPTYSPMVHVPPYKGSKHVFSKNNPGHPAYDSAFQGTYPAGSTFKPITATAAYESGVLAPGESLECPGTYYSKYDTAKQRTPFHDWTLDDMGSMGLAKALEVSCDTFFYQLGDQFYGMGGPGEQFQGWIRKLGYGSPPPLDAGGAQAGTVPDPKWKATQNWQGTPAQQEIERLWLPGDDINMSIGQGNLLVSPLQQAVAYSALENGGKVVTPHVGQAILEPGSTTQAIPGGRIDPGPVRDLHLPQELLSEIKQGLYGATHAGDGTSTATFGNFQPTVYGKTGTAEVPTTDCPNCADAWWAGWAEQGGKPIVVVAFIHDGGHGGVSAAPVAASIFQSFYDPRSPYSFHAGTDQSR
ncbi:MAG TPA: penicillin-binding transpeptidase domain-containing protein [Gaiellales bacterium]|nr:penicillin-binding transpeptidase domain-containing protein [Gaiellales bacterium]